jgi:glycosyltransferase involved in cell wall biosynthesis
MKIAINAVSAKMGGAVSYLTSLLQHLPIPESGYQFLVFLPDKTAELMPDVRENIKLFPLPSRVADSWRRLWWEQVALRRFLVREKVDALYSTANFAMFRCPVKQILLVRNAVYFSNLYQKMIVPRQSLKRRTAFRFSRWLICRSVRSADLVMTPTRAMLEELRAYVDIADSRALVNHYGVTFEGTNGGPNVSTTPARDFGESADTVRLLYISLYNEYKNLQTLLKALPLLNCSGRRKWVLTTTVDPGWAEVAWMLTQKDDLALARQADVAPWVGFVGPLPRGQAVRLYREPDMFVFPSLCESFGHPMVEAMAHGLPIIASDTPVNREVCGHAAVYFSPLSAEDLAEQVKALAQAPALMGELGAAGRERAATVFRWDRHVQRILECAGGPHDDAPRAPVRH